MISAFSKEKWSIYQTIKYTDVDFLLKVMSNACVYVGGHCKINGYKPKKETCIFIPHDEPRACHEC